MPYKVTAKIGKGLLAVPKYYNYMNDRMYELTGKGYSPEVAAAMTTSELGVAAVATMASQGLILNASAATGGVLGGEIGMLIAGPGGFFLGGMTGTAIAQMLGSAAAFEAYLAMTGAGLEGLIPPGMNLEDVEGLLNGLDPKQLRPDGGDPARDPWDDGNRQGPYPNDPLVFDLDGDNSLSVTNAQGGINFDHDGDGFAQLSAWVAQGDGILCIDRNGNGTIDNGLEIFGENMKLSNGSNATSALHALSEFDTNQDGIIDANDADFANLRFITSDGTLVTMAEAGIVSINLDAVYNETEDEHGNRNTATATFVRDDSLKRAA